MAGHWRRPEPLMARTLAAERQMYCNAPNYHCKQRVGGDTTHLRKRPFLKATILILCAPPCTKKKEARLVFTHLVKRSALDRLFKEAGQYHISVLFRSDYEALLEDPRTRSRAASALRVDGGDPADSVRCDGFVVVHDFVASLFADLLWLHENGQYWNREMHISM